LQAPPFFKQALAEMQANQGTMRRSKNTASLVPLYAVVVQIPYGHVHDMRHRQTPVISSSAALQTLLKNSRDKREDVKKKKNLEATQNP